MIETRRIETVPDLVFDVSVAGDADAPLVPERPGERRGVRARQHRQRGETLRMAIRDQPGEAAAPIMADQMKAPLTMASGVGDVEGIADQPVDAIAVKVFRIGPRVD